MSMKNMMNALQRIVFTTMIEDYNNGKATLDQVIAEVMKMQLDNFKKLKIAQELQKQSNNGWDKIQYHNNIELWTALGV